MSLRSLFPALVLAASSATLPAQAYELSKRSFGHELALRQRLLELCLGADADLRTAVTERYAARDRISTFERTLEALALLAGHGADADYRMRGSLVPIVLPHVVDPEVEARIHVTPFAPFSLARNAALGFRAELHDEDELLQEAEFDVSDVGRLQTGASTVALGIEKTLDRGLRRVRLHTTVDGRGERGFERVPEREFRVWRGFKSRVDLFEKQARSMDRPRPEDWALLVGVLWDVQAVLAGDAWFPGVSDPPLETAERIVDNLESGQSVLDGITGRLTIGVCATEPSGDRAPEGDEILRVSIEIPERSDDRRPLLLFVPGGPLWDVAGNRPRNSDHVRPEWLRAQLDRVGFDPDGRYHVAVVESPGRVDNHSAALARASERLCELLPVEGGQVVWVGERTGAYSIAAALRRPEQRAPRALVLAVGGSMDRSDMARLGDVPILAITSAGHGTREPMRQLARHAEALGRPGQVRLHEPVGDPWPLALPLARAEIEDFVAEVLSPAHRGGENQRPVRDAEAPQPTVAFLVGTVGVVVLLVLGVALSLRRRPPRGPDTAR